MFVPESPIIAPVDSEVAKALSNSPHEIYSDHAPALREKHNFERINRTGPRAGSAITSPYSSEARRAFDGDRGFHPSPLILYQEARNADHQEAAVFYTGDSFNRASDSYFTPSERRAFDEAVGEDGQSGLMSRAEVKRVARLQQDALQRMGLGRLGRELRDGNLISLAQEKARMLVDQLEGSEDTVTDASSIKPLIDNLHSNDDPLVRLVVAGASLAAWAALRKRGNRMLAATVLMFGLGQYADSCVRQPSAPELVASSPFQTQVVGDAEATILDNYPVSAADPGASIGPLIGVSTEQEPNFRTLAGAMLAVLGQKKYSGVEITSLSYEHLPPGPDGIGDLERLVAATRQTTRTGEPLFIVANMNPNSGVDVTTVVRSESEKAQLMFADGTIREASVTDVYRFVESDGTGGYVSGDFMQAVYRDPVTGQEYIIVNDPEDGEQLVFVLKDGVNPDDVFTGGGGSGKFGPKLALLKPVPTIPAPAEVQATQTPPSVYTPVFTPTPDTLASATAIVESSPTSCLDSVVQDRVESTFLASDFAKTKGFTSLDDARTYFAEFDQKNVVGWLEPQRSYNRYALFHNLMLIGEEKISLAHRTGNSEDFAQCLFFVHPNVPGKTIPIVVSLQRDGRWAPLVSFQYPYSLGKFDNMTTPSDVERWSREHLGEVIRTGITVQYPTVTDASNDTFWITVNKDGYELARPLIIEGDMYVVRATKQGLWVKGQTSLYGLLDFLDSAQDIGFIAPTIYIIPQDRIESGNY